jgi:two-component system OmpR family sensor kinase
MQSLRIRLLLLLGAEIIVAALLQFFASYEAAMHEANKLFDYHLQQMASALQDSDFQDPGWQRHARNDDGFDVAIQIWSDEGYPAYQSGGSPFPFRQEHPGFSMVTMKDGDWRVYTQKAEGRTIQVAQRMEARRDRASSLALQTVSPTIPVSLLSLLAIWGVISAAISPLNRIGRELAKRHAGSLAPVSEAGVPKEVSRLTSELNSLLGRLEHALESQQRFVADAAHELRSPLTALKLQVQTLMRARDEQAREQGAQRLLGGIDRASRLVEQLLALARQDPLLQTAAARPVKLLACLELAAGDVAPFAAAKDIEVQYDGGRDMEAPEVPGDAEGWRVLIRNLLDNAVRYTPEHGSVRISLSARDGAGMLAIEDSGPGISEQDRARVFDRFYRIPGTAPGGSGLGLAIVKAIADRHGASVELAEASLGGLAVRVRFALPAQPGT